MCLYCHCEYEIKQTINRIPDEFFIRTKNQRILYYIFTYHPLLTDTHPKLFRAVYSSKKQHDFYKCSCAMSFFFFVELSIDMDTQCPRCITIHFSVNVDSNEIKSDKGKGTHSICEKCGPFAVQCYFRRCLLPFVQNLVRTIYKCTQKLNHLSNNSNNNAYHIC